MNTNNLWEEIPSPPNTPSERLAVPGGWVIRSCTDFRNESVCLHQVFISDPGHDWKLTDYATY